MLHQFDANAIAHQKQLNEQFLQQQQQQQQQQGHLHQQQELQQLLQQRQHQQHQQDLHHLQQQQQSQFHNSSVATVDSQQSSSYIQERYGAATITAPFIMNPTILASQDQELHPHLVPRSSQQQQQQQQQRQQQNHPYTEDQMGLHLQELHNIVNKGPPYDFDSAFQRKRSLSVPMLFPPNPQQLNSEPPGSNTTAATAEAAASTATTATTTTAENLQDTNGNNADHDMETDDNAIPVLSSPGVVQERANQRGREYYIERDSAASKVLKSHRHRNYAGYPSLYYSHNHNHNHYTLRHHLHYNPLTHRKFPPYQYWAASAQRNYHLSTIGILPQCSPEIGRYSGAAGQEFLKIAESTILAIAGGRPPPGVGDRILRTSTRNGGVNKSAAYPSRLPVHFRHMTSRTNRRPAICVNPFQGDNSTTSSSSTTNQQLRQQGHRGEEGHGGSTAVAKTKTSTAGSKAISGVLPLFSGLSIEDSNVQSDSTSSSSLSAVGRSIDSSSSASNRKKLTVDWKRVTAFSIDLEGDSQRSSGSEMVMRLSSNGSVTDSKASSIGGSSAKGTGSGRHWASQRGGLANLLQVKQSQDGSTVDRLVEEMNKWSV